MKSLYIKIFIVIAIFNVGIFGQQYSGKLVELNGKKVTNSKASIDLKWRTGGLSGNAGCNRMFGSFSSRGNVIRFSGIGTTRMFCNAPGVMKREGEFLQALRDATRYRLSGATLRIYAGSRQVLKFERGYDEVAEDPTGLEDKKWVWDHKKSGSGHNPPDPFINFDKIKGSAGGNTGCNVFGGSYTSTGSSISITDIISTMRACIEDDRMDMERKFLNSLRMANRYEIKENELYLYESSTLLLRLRGTTK